MDRVEPLYTCDKQTWLLIPREWWSTGTPSPTTFKTGWVRCFPSLSLSHFSLVMGLQALKQQVFFTASAPLTGKHVNVSPKGLPSSTFSIFDPNHAAYVDATGSGNETISHVYENGRITIMFCSFASAPRIMRFFCWGKVVEWDQPGFEGLIGKMGKEKIQGARAVVLLDVFKVREGSTTTIIIPIISCVLGATRLADA